MSKNDDCESQDALKKQIERMKQNRNKNSNQICDDIYHRQNKRSVKFYSNILKVCSISYLSH